MSDVRRLLKKQKQERAKRVEHPFAKYDDTGRLLCIVCNSLVKNENVWPAHLGSSLHRQQIEKLKALKNKRPAPEQEQGQQAKRTKFENISSDEEEDDEEEEHKEDLPSDFFDQQEEPMEEDIPEPVKPNTIPAGFFDDPEQEAKAQRVANEQAKLTLEKDLNEFHETMIDVSAETKQLEEEDDETLYANRNQDIFEEQAILDARVEKLKQMRSTGTIVPKEQDDDDEMRQELKTNVRHLLAKKQSKSVSSMFDDDESSSDDE
ncbi:hypothetical protein G6F46_000341 [Rhizopus delemar]|uniref:Zinc finger protein 830 n=2 Tax=Rhizopus TaxID=4842 RepID=A0A9P7CVF2_9FUNG|nr:hypothetical protein G6F55_000112 [Rhizopus delemar]KAG1554019.1 hypothetical protein G6F51_000215 [Rhizopus arrhizus]KAG1505359.1 hypothetical protein G6F54_000354 [Rhizopus delemar]KAG1518788.1 hypothetical protein G6F53_000293 [Rhizopus delemar]KAG1529123.1 hypothetical protein G6F52_000033 [Rhizopus delemar]